MSLTTVQKNRMGDNPGQDTTQQNNVNNYSNVTSTLRFGVVVRSGVGGARSGVVW
jgi:hypothetical protein